MLHALHTGLGAIYLYRMERCRSAGTDDRLALTFYKESVPLERLCVYEQTRSEQCNIGA